jgi:hypothetical protein
MRRRRSREELRRVAEHAHGLEAETRAVGRDLVRLELPADLGEDHLALRDSEAPSGLRQVDRLLAQEARVDLDAVEEGVVVRDVLDRGRVDRRPELAVHAREEVPRERRAPPGAVVVRGLERPDVLHEVDADQEVVAGRQARRGAVDEVGRLLRVEVADRAPEEDEEERGEVAEEGKGALVRRGDAADREPGCSAASAAHDCASMPKLTSTGT